MNSCQTCAQVAFKPSSYLKYIKTGLILEFPHDCECALGNNEKFPNRGDECEDYVHEKFLSKSA